MPQPTIALRDYQREALDLVHRSAERGVRRQLGVAATGLGKTVMFCALAREMRVRTLVLAHRDELIEQAAASVRTWWPDADVGVVKGDRNEVDATVVVASVQTLSRPARLADLLAPSALWDAVPFGLVIVDEAHHAAAPSYRTVLDGLRCGETDGPLLLGVTATPDRGDGLGLDDVFDEITFSYDIRWGIAREFLSDLRGLRVELDVDMSKLKVTGGDYNQGQAGAMLEDAHAPSLIVKAWRAHAPGRRTLVFTPTVALAEAVAAEFNEHGIPAGAVSGDMPIEARRATLAAYSAGELQVVANCAVLTEGYDEPRTDCVVVARPTKSRALYTQMVGRGTRRHPEKTDCLVIDVVGATDMHDLVTVPSLFGVEQPDRVWSGGSTVTEALREQVERHEAEGVLRASETALFDKVRSTGRLAWVTVHTDAERRYEAGLGFHGRLVLVNQHDDRWLAGWQDGEGIKRVLCSDVVLETAQAVAEDQARKLKVMALAAADAPWRADRPTAKQLALAVKLGIEVPMGCTKGQLSELIDAKLASRKGKGGTWG
jgi:ATP-dependent helicase IRC3